MKLFDPFSGYRLAYGNPLLHIGYFIAIFLLPHEPTCSEVHYDKSKIALQVSHIVVFSFSILAWLLHVCDLTVFSRALDFFAIFLY